MLLMAKPLHEVIETPEYFRDAKKAGMSDAEMWRAVMEYATKPDLGEEVVGSGGVRKGRMAGKGKGKSGGYRIMSLYIATHIPVYLFGMLFKGDRETFTATEIKQFKLLSSAIKAAYRGRKRP
jgi:hypothetical protein